MISDELKCIFLHPNKCGGKSIESALWDVTPIPGSADHRTIVEYESLYPDKTRDYFKFMFCRNPWDRLVSIYHGRKQILKVQMPSFNSFVRNFEPNESPTQSQVLWIKSGSKYNIDFVGRFENYENDWIHICKELGIKKVLPHKNKSKHIHYSELYDKKLEEVVRIKYKDDIEYFEYDFLTGAK